MRINELIFEDDEYDGSDLTKMPVVTFGDKKLTVGDIQKYVPEVDPQTIIKHASTINDYVQKYGDTALTVASFAPWVRGALLAKSGAGLVKAIASGEMTRQAGKAVAKDITLIPTLQPDKDTSSKDTSTMTAQRKRKFNVGDVINVTVNGKQANVPIKNVLPSGYEVDVSKVPGSKPGQTMTVPEPT